MKRVVDFDVLIVGAGHAGCEAMAEKWKGKAGLWYLDGKNYVIRFVKEDVKPAINLGRDVLKGVVTTKPASQDKGAN